MNSSSPIAQYGNSTPITSPLASRKRRCDSYSDTPSSPMGESLENKKFQSSRIFSEAHVYTVNLMLEASRSLSKNDKSQDTLCEEVVREEQQQESTYKQRPYWPEIVRKK